MGGEQERERRCKWIVVLGEEEREKIEDRRWRIEDRKANHQQP
jgi:hypothetical protein